MLSALSITLVFSASSFGLALPAVDRSGRSWSWSWSWSWNWESPRDLKFTQDGTFQIAIFSDLHFGENPQDSWGPQQDINTTRVMHNVLDAECQQLVVLNGDLITGENTYLYNSTEYVDQVVGPMVERNIPWASTYGNHDSQFNLSRENLLARERLYLNSLTDKMVFDPNAGVSNYYLPVYAHSGSRVPKMLLWFFDSRGGFLYQQTNATGDQIEQPDWVDQSVVIWFKATNAQLVQQYGRVIPSLAFVHIPTNASLVLQTEAKVHPHYQPGIDDDYPLAQQAQGWCRTGAIDGTCDYGGQDTPFMEAIASTPGLMALFSGHDHGNTWCYRWDRQLPGMDFAGNGVNLCFGQHSGYGGYGSWVRGARQVLVTDQSLRDCAVDTWIRLETGDVVGSVNLNATYGKDFYPATKNTKTS